MKGTKVLEDESGKEAFAYLAILLLVLTGAFAAYSYSLKKDGEERAHDLERTLRVRSMMDSVLVGLRLRTKDLHETALVESEDRLMDGEGLRLYAMVEDRLKERIPGMVMAELRSLNSTDRTVLWDLMEVNVDSRPVLGTMDGPVPETGPSCGNITESIEGGRSSYGKRPESVGVSTTVTVLVKAYSAGGGLDVRDGITVEVERLSPADLISSRGDRLGEALSTGELSRTASYLLGTLAQTKAFLGHGRGPSGPLGETSGPLLTGEEVAACMDLSVALISRAHLGHLDGVLVNGSKAALSTAPGSGGDIPDLLSLVQSSRTPMDPSLLAILSEGLFSSSNPPSLEKMLRPLLYSVLNDLILKLIDFLGMDEELFMLVGGFSKVVDTVVSVLDTDVGTLFGNEAIGSVVEALDRAILSLLEEGGIIPPEDGLLMARSFPKGPDWMGGPITCYPPLVLPDMERQVPVFISSMADEDMVYISENGTVHTKEEYFDPDDRFLGYYCDKYIVELDVSIDPIGPDFHPVDILSDNGFKRGVLDLLGQDGAGEVDSSEQDLIELGHRALEEAVESLIARLSRNGEGMWRSVWKGWSPEELPPLDSPAHPFSLLTAINCDALEALIEGLTGDIIDSFTELDLSGEVAATGGSIGIGLANWLLREYDRFVDRQGQEDGTFMSAHAALPFHATIKSRSYRLEIERTVFGNTLDIIVDAKRDMTPLMSDDPRLIEMAMDLTPEGLGYGPLIENLSHAVAESFLTVKSREVGSGDDGKEPGIIFNALCGASTRGAYGGILGWEGGPDNIADVCKGLFDDAMRSIEGHFLSFQDVLGLRVMAPPGGGAGIALPLHPEDMACGISLRSSVRRSPIWRAEVLPGKGIHNIDITDGSPPYTTPFKIEFEGTYALTISELGGDSEGLVKVVEVEADIELDIEVSTVWEMTGGTYEEKGSLAQKMTDIAGEAKDLVLDGLLGRAKDLFGDALGSLHEVPPLVADILKGRDLDITEAARVLTNVTLELSTSLREIVKSAIRSLIELGAEGVIKTALDTLGVETLDFDLEMGGASMSLRSQRRALEGEDGTLLEAGIGLPSIGLDGTFRLTREHAKVLFLGNVTYESGPLFIRMALDPFMTSSAHMISVEGVMKGARDLRFSFSCPDLKEYRSLEVSIKGTLGMEVIVPVPILGIQAVIDAGFRIRYQGPDEIGPHINEVAFEGTNLTAVEIYDPRRTPVNGSTIELQDGDGARVGVWEVRAPPSVFIAVHLKDVGPIGWSKPLTRSGTARVLLRAPSGEILDAVEAEDVRTGCYSRDKDGYGILRWANGTLGRSNGGQLPVSLSSLIVSIALDSLKEAYNESKALYPLSLEMVAHLVGRAIDLFVDRLLSVIRELVLDVRAFVHIEVEDASGSGGYGFEISFLALGEAVADFMEWVRQNIKAFIADIAPGAGPGDYSDFPVGLLSDCFIEVLYFSQVETPVPVSRVCPPGTEIPSSLTMGVVCGFNIALPLRLLGIGAGDLDIYGGVYVMECPSQIVSLFYDVDPKGGKSDLWLLRIAIWEEGGS